MVFDGVFKEGGKGEKIEKGGGLGGGAWVDEMELRNEGVGWENGEGVAARVSIAKYLV